MRSELEVSNLHRNNSTTSRTSTTTRKNLPFNYMRSSSTSSSTTARTSINSSNQFSSYDIDHDHIDYHFSFSSSADTVKPLVARKYGGIIHARRRRFEDTSNTVNYKATGGSKTSLLSIIRSLFCYISLPNFISTSSTCRWMTIPSRLLTTSPASYSLGRKVTGTLFGHKKGHVSFAVQHDPRSEPVLLLELATSTAMLIKEMSSGLVRIALECERGSSEGGGGGGGGGRGRSINKLFQEPMWTMYCNGKKCGYAISRKCKESDWHVLSTVQTVSAGAGVIPMDKVATGNWSEGELMYMRARFERVVGNRDSEAFYMMNPDGTGGPELSIFLLRI
ncbi:Protein of unknown function DUF617 [Macleaya cordata]|uniref:Protein MIZU-KUSSEI 1 n=1 Tax=Macleaya cordata TaxID=56857 RepID=A0A200Q0P3_MACCD|nr:Protein of unknown function DUF617 [Macleaya cordata]